MMGSIAAEDAPINVAAAARSAMRRIMVLLEDIKATKVGAGKKGRGV